MPATEETYRSQSGLHIVFAITSIAMTLSIVWMVAADHLRPWKQVQREFHDVEVAKLEAAKKEKLADQSAKKKERIEAIDAEVAAAEAKKDENASALYKLDGELRVVQGRFEKLDTEKKFQKAELDSQRSLYDGMIERGEERHAREYLRTVIVKSEARLLDLSERFEEVSGELAKLKSTKEDLLGHVDNLKKEKEDLTRDVDRIDRALTQKEEQYLGPLAWFRGLPFIDLAAPPTKIQQISLPELTINYNFKDVPRYDRCQTCHQGIDRLGYDKDPEGKPMKDLNAAFAAHPHLTDGATAVDPRGNVVKAGLYLDSNGPHPINSFGCTICHGGQGSGTDFTYSSHEPNDLAQKEEWTENLAWKEIHHWDYPMLPKRFVESSCIKCHHEVTDVPQAKKLQAGYQRIVKYGCTGCHTIGGEGSFGPDLTDERQVGPSLRGIASKVSKDWTLKWIKNPHAFRPDTRMPKFYGLTNNDAKEDWPKNHAEIHAITTYLFAKSAPPAGFVEPPAKGDAKHGEQLFLQKGCLACHQHKDYAASKFPEPAREFVDANFGPNLSNMAAKFSSQASGYKWLANWIHAPEAYHAKTLMPNLQLSLADAADIATWILSVKAEWPTPVEVPPVESTEVQESLNYLVKLYVAKGGFLENGKLTTVPLSEVESFVKEKLTTQQKLMYLGEKTISRLGCFGCHNIPGYENAKPIGTPLNGWGSKSPTKLDYGHIAEYLSDQPIADDKSRDGTDEYYQEKILEQTRSGFLYEKLHRPRSYDYKKTNEDLKAWDDRLRMPQFVWANDPKAVEEVMTFVLGLTGEKISARYLPKTHYKPAQFAKAQGEKLLNRYNCRGCHVLEMPKYTVSAGTKFEDAFTDFATNVRVSYNNRSTDYLAQFTPGLTHDADKPPALKPAKPEEVTIEGMPIGLFENELTVSLWKPAMIRGYQFNVGDTITLDKTKIATTPAEGGDFAWIYAYNEAERTGGDFASLWNRLPPPLVREGLKVQTPWLTAFLKDPYAIRPAANLRMPRFHLGKTDDLAPVEASRLSNYFAARDGAEFPYPAVPEQEQSYLVAREAKHPAYLAGGWQLITKGACVQCHAVGQYLPTGGAQVINGPNLRQVAERFRPEFLKLWIAKPSRLVPYTAMPQNIPPLGPPPPGVPKSFENQPFEQVLAVRDTLLNYVTAIEQQLVQTPAGAKPPTPAATAPGGAKGAGAGGQ